VPGHVVGRLRSRSQRTAPRGGALAGCGEKPVSVLAPALGDDLSGRLARLSPDARFWLPAEPVDVRQAADPPAFSRALR